ncbi:helix-turn-helix domain-containing protein [Anaerospora hongkongensis]|uniref:helix-turn-helix domain-containing protein n=1 Tax=Anaerospora hongkongensis TaxID=244830 RepID=UPI00289EFF3C|nr:helix-turn-helix transcriptional regulator [Anaerospora hongkongensis]
MQLGDRLRQAREHRGLTQIQVKNATNINNKTLSNYENNISSPDPYTLKILADLYKVTTDWLICGKNNSLQSQLLPSMTISAEDLELLRKFKSLSEQKRKAIEILVFDKD